MAQYKDHIDKDLFEQIEAYLVDAMDAASRAAFEKQIQTDESLKSEVELQSMLMASIETFTHNHATSSKKDGRTAIRKMPRVWLYAAAMIAIVVTAWFFWHNTNTPERIFARYFIPDDGLPIAMSSPEEHYDFYNGMVSYKEGNYVQALDIWKRIQQVSDTLLYYQGVASLNNNNHKAAIQFLLPVAQNNQSTWQTKAVWYLALAQLKNNNTAEALSWLEKLNDNEQSALLKKDIEKLSP